MAHDYGHHDYPEKPWDKRLRGQPLRTYSGSIKYPKPKKYFTDRDIERIMRRFQQDQGINTATQTTLERLLGTILSFWLDVLKALEPFDYWGFGDLLCNTLNDVLVRITYMAWEPWNTSKVIDMIMLLASRASKIEVTIKRLP